MGNYWIDPDGTRTGVPTFWLALALTYDSAEFSSAPTTYDVLLDPKYKGKVTVVDAATDVFGTASVALGLDFSKMSEDDFSKLVDWTKQLVAQTDGLATAYGDMATRLAAGDAVLAFPGWAAVNQSRPTQARKRSSGRSPRKAASARSMPTQSPSPLTIPRRRMPGSMKRSLRR